MHPDSSVFIALATASKIYDFKNCSWRNHYSRKVRFLQFLLQAYVHEWPKTPNYIYSIPYNHELLELKILPFRGNFVVMSVTL